METGTYGLPRRSAVRKRRMRRLRAVAAIVALLVIWLGFSVVREMAKVLPATASVELQTASGTSTSDDSSTSAQGAGGSASVFSQLPNVVGADLSAPVAATVFAEEASVAAPLSELPEADAHVPFLQAALSEAQAGPTGGYGRSRGAFGGGGGVPAMWGGGAGAAEPADAPELTDDAALPGDGKASVLGRRFLADSGESNEPAASSENGSNGSSGSNGGNGGSSEQSVISNASAPSGSNGGSGSNGDSGSTGSNGPSEIGGVSQGGNGGDQGGAPESGVTSLAVVANESPTTTGGDEEVRDVPEPGSILLALGAAAALARRRAC